LPPESLLLAHSYERVMPGPEYLSSIVNFWRVYAGATESAADRCERFLRTVINTDDYPLRRLSSTTASESGKLLENTYRAVNIALIDEWSRFAERVGIDLFEIVDAVRVRPTHSNIREPGFGVGGYCLTKDPLFADIGARELFGLSDLSFDFAKLSVATNEKMPLATLARIREHYAGKIAGKRMLVCGVSYRSDVGDTRYSPTETFARSASAAGAELSFQDPLVGYWDEMQTKVAAELPNPAGFDAIIFAVRHAEYRSLDVGRWLGSSRPLVVDANGVLSATQRLTLAAAGCPAISIGRGNRVDG
jgi:nucleotide sugar dehydrogenase